MTNQNDPELPIKLDLELIKNNLPKYNSTKLCEMIVCDRYFGFNQQIAVMCMEELAKRRQAGDLFDFEAYIEQAYQKLPPLTFKIPDLRSSLQQMINVNKKTK